MTDKSKVLGLFRLPTKIISITIDDVTLLQKKTIFEKVQVTF